MYATQQDIVDRYSADALLMVTDRDGNVDVQQVLRALEDADDEINTYIGKRYPLPLVMVPRVITRVALDLRCIDCLTAQAIQKSVGNVTTML